MKENLIPPKIRLLLTPVGFLIVLVFLFIVLARVAVVRISDQRARLGESRKTENVLESKLSTLNAVQGEAIDLANLTVAALPQDNPALSVVSQIKNLSASLGLTLRNLKVGGEMGEGSLFREEIVFDLAGPLSQIVEFLNTLKTLAPITTLQKIEFSQTQGISLATVTIRSYWAAFPTSLPEISDPTPSLTDEEREMISQLSSLGAPAFIEVTPSEPTVRGDPFN